MTTTTTPATTPRPVLPVLPLGTVDEAPQEFRHAAQQIAREHCACGGHKLADGPRTATKPLVGARFTPLRHGSVAATQTAPDARYFARYLVTRSPNSARLRGGLRG